MLDTYGATILCVLLALLNVPFFPSTINVVAFILCLVMAGFCLGAGLVARR